MANPLRLRLVAAACVLAWATSAHAMDTATGATPSALTTPATVDTSIGRLEFKDGVPSEATAQKLYDQLDLQRGVDAFMNGLRGVSIFAARKGIRDAGVADNNVLIFSGRPASRSTARRPTR